MVDSYALIFAGMLFTAGTLGDRFGRKGALQFGLVLFMAGALFASFSDSSGQIIAARAIMGLAAAFIMPSTLSILTNVFPAHERTQAIAIWAGVSGAGVAIGPITSGLLLEHFWWGSVFLVNVPVIIVAVIAGAILLPKSKDPGDHPIDVPGAALSIVALSSLVYGIIEGPHNGWTSAATLGAFALSAVAIGLFIWRESTAAHPMLDLKLFSDRRFSVASGGMTLTFFAMFGTFFLLAQYLQLVLGYSPLESGLLQLPFAFIIMLIAPQVPRFVKRFGSAAVVPVGMTFIATGLALLSILQVDSSLWALYSSMIPLATGMAISMTPLTSLIMSSVPLGRAGVGLGDERHDPRARRRTRRGHPRIDRVVAVRIGDLVGARRATRPGTGDRRHGPHRCVGRRRADRRRSGSVARRRGAAGVRRRARHGCHRRLARRARRGNRCAPPPPASG